MQIQNSTSQVGSVLETGKLNLKFMWKCKPIFKNSSKDVGLMISRLTLKLL